MVRIHRLEYSWFGTSHGASPQWSLGGLRYVVALATLQTGFLLFGALGMELGAFTPGWVWVGIVLLTGPAIVVGGRQRLRADRD